MHVLLLETSGNQAYIFGTNRLRENVGASQLTYVAGTTWVEDGLKSVLGSVPIHGIEAQTGDRGAEVVVSTSGKAVVLFDQEEDARAVITAVTRRALHEAPGLDIAGTVSGAFDWSEAGALHGALAEVHRTFEQVKAEVPSPLTRFQRLPLIADCSSSGRPAAHVIGPWINDEPDEDDRQPFSAESFAKRLAAGDGYARLRQAVEAAAGVRLPRNLRDLERALEGRTTTGDSELRVIDWLGVVHVDGNGLGQVFLGLDGYAHKDNRTYADTLGGLSRRLDDACRRAFQEAAAAMWDRTRVRRRRKDGTDEPLALIPLVLGGDDMTALCDGAEAIRFARDYIEAFERLAREEVSGLPWRDTPPGITAAGGVAIIKPHFPFSVGYELSESLVRSAKSVKRLGEGPGAPVSSLDFHVVYDASVAGLDAIRERLTLVEGGARYCLYHRPYLLGAAREAVSKTHGLPRLDGLERRIAATVAVDPEGRRRYPSTQLHGLRAALFQGAADAEAALRLIVHRYPGLDSHVGWSVDGMPAPAGATIFDAPAGKDSERHTLLLDVMEHLAFLAPLDAPAEEGGAQ